MSQNNKNDKGTIIILCPECQNVNYYCHYTKEEKDNIVKTNITDNKFICDKVSNSEFHKQI